MTPRSRTLLSLATAAVLLVPWPAQAATTLGHTFPAQNAASCNGGPEFQAFQLTPSTTVQAPGVITSWTFESGVEATTLTMRVFHLINLGTYTPVADAGPLVTFAPISGVHTTPTRIPVRAGDIVGLRSTVGACLSPGTPSDVIYHSSGPVTPVNGTTSMSSTASYLVDISAVVEPDADADQYGDETQDLCPGDPATHGACPAPVTTITRTPKATSHSTKSKVKFTSSLPGSTFTCSIDGRRARACTSPRSYFCLATGKHAFSVTATSPLGISDPTPAKKKFRVPSGRKGC